MFLRFGLLGISVWLGCVLPAACANGAAPVTVFAAASLKNALDELVERFIADTGTPVVVSYAGTPMLARQIEKGAPADIFISADTDWMDYLDRRKGIRAGTRVDLLSNRLALVAPSDSALALAIKPDFRLAEALGGGRLAMADPDSVPAGRYGKAALEVLGVWKEVAPKVARAENVRAALALVARAEAPLGIVYATDAVAEKRVRVVGEFSPTLHPRIVYPAALIATSRSQGAAPFLRFLQSEPAQRVWRRHGFSAGQ